MKVMKRYGISLLLLALLPTASFASCLYPAACYEVGGSIETCRVIEKDGESFLELRFKGEATVREASCGDSPTREPRTETELADRVKYLSSRKAYFVRTSFGFTCEKLQASPFLGKVEETCCDTVPAMGYCALDGPLLVPQP